MSSCSTAPCPTNQWYVLTTRFTALHNVTSILPLTPSLPSFPPTPYLSQNGNVTPLMCAAFGNHCECVTLLLAAGADPSVTMTAHNGVFDAGPGTTALDLATKKGHGEAAALLRL